MADREELDDSQMPFVEHLRELRERLRWSVAAVFVCFCVAYFFKEQLYEIIKLPLEDVRERMAGADGVKPKLIFTKITEPFWTYFSLALWTGIFAASPMVFYQVWKFVAPGLYQRERRYGLAFAVASGILFLGGAVFCYFLVLDPVYSFLLSFESEELVSMLSMGEYLSFARKLLLGFGLVFELPLFILMLSLVGVVTHRSLWKFNRWWIVLSFVLAAALTPPDPASQILMAAPLIVLYNISIILAYIITKRREAREAKMARGELDE
jgi:sec-independent protein translocase protein TatC